MAVVALLVLLAGSFAGLLTGRWIVVVPLLAAVLSAALLGGPEAGALSGLGAAGFLAGVQLHRVVAEQYVPR
jgi:ABC-type spermidine/putrescine transport system permease subunit I